MTAAVTPIQLISAARQRGYLMLTVVLMVGCVRYHAQPLSDDAVSATLAVPTAEVIRVRASELSHPRLAPLPVDTTGSLTPEQVAVVAILLNPGLRALRDERAVAQAQLLQAGILPNPQLSLGTDLAVSSPDGSATPGHSIGLDWEATSLITRGAHRDGAAAHGGEVDLDIAWQEWSVALAARQSALRVIGAEQRIALAAELEHDLVERATRVRHAVAKGLLLASDQATAETDASEATSQLMDLRQEATAERLQLNRQLGFPPQRHVALHVGEWRTAAPLTTGLDEDLAHQRLDLLALRRGYDSQEAAVRAAVLGQFPKISIGFTHARDTGQVTSLGLGVSIGLPIFDRNQGVIAIETATRQRLFDEYVQRLFEARSDLATAVTESGAVAAAIVRRDAEIVVLEDRAAALSQALAKQQIAEDPLLDVRRRVLQLRLDGLSLRQRLAELRVAVEVAAGCLLADDPAVNQSEKKE